MTNSPSPAMLSKEELKISSTMSMYGPPSASAKNFATTSPLCEVAEAIEPFANTVKHDIGADETDHDTFRPMTSPYHRAPLLTVGNLRALSALHDKMEVD